MGGTTTAPTTETTAATTLDPANADLPPGVTSAGVANASALVSAHRDALAETGYEFELRASRGRGAESVQRGVATAGPSSILLTGTATASRS